MMPTQDCQEVGVYALALAIAGPLTLTLSLTLTLLQYRDANHLPNP